MYKIFSIAIACLSLIGCAHTQAPVPVPAEPTHEVPAPVGRTDLPYGWIEIKNDNWSFGIPKTFEKVNGANSVYLFKSKDESTLIDFEPDDTTDSLDDYSASFSQGMISLGPQLVSVGRGTMAGKDAVMFVFDMNEKVVAIHFIAVDGKKAYNLDCTIAAIVLQKQLHICDQVLRSLIIK